jgi:hypothetical protein
VPQLHAVPPNLLQEVVSGCGHGSVPAAAIKQTVLRVTGLLLSSGREAGICVDLEKKFVREVGLSDTDVRRRG